MKWHDDGATLSQDEITDMVNTNAAGLYEFQEDPSGSAEVLAAWNIGVSEIIGIGNDITQAESLNALKQVMTEWKALILPKNVITKFPVLVITSYSIHYTKLYETTRVLSTMKNMELIFQIENGYARHFVSMFQ